MLFSVTRRRDQQTPDFSGETLRQFFFCKALFDHLQFLLWLISRSLQPPLNSRATNAQQSSDLVTLGGGVPIPSDGGPTWTDISPG